MSGVGSDKNTEHIFESTESPLLAILLSLRISLSRFQENIHPYPYSLNHNKISSLEFLYTQDFKMPGIVKYWAYLYFDDGWGGIFLCSNHCPRLATPAWSSMWSMPRLMSTKSWGLGK